MKIHHNFPLSKILFYHIGGTARFVLDAQSSDDIVEAVEFVQRNRIERVQMVGLGTNLLMSDEDFSGAVIRIHKGKRVDIHMTNDGLVSAYAGQTLDELIHFAFHKSFTGLEALGGLPSTVGGAIRGNAGAFGTEMKDVIEKVEVLHLTNDGYTIKEFSNNDCQFGYRDSFFKHHKDYIILRGFFQLNESSNKGLVDAKKIYLSNIAYRKKNHPVEYPSCGSIFKNIKDPKQVEKILTVWPDVEEAVLKKWYGKVSMGYIIKRLGFSGIQVGGAKITEKHANYISNVNKATAADVLKIIEQIRERFQETFGFPPDLEAEIIQ